MASGRRRDSVFELYALEVDEYSVPIVPASEPESLTRSLSDGRNIKKRNNRHESKRAHGRHLTQQEHRDATYSSINQILSISSFLSKEPNSLISVY